MEKRRSWTVIQKSTELICKIFLPAICFLWVIFLWTWTKSYALPLNPWWWSSSVSYVCLYFQEETQGLAHHGFAIAACLAHFPWAFLLLYIFLLILYMCWKNPRAATEKLCSASHWCSDRMIMILHWAMWLNWFLYLSKSNGSCLLSASSSV